MADTSGVQYKNIAWFLPRPKPDRYKGGMPLHCEGQLLSLARDMINIIGPKVLNLFCGMNKEGFRIDMKKEVNPDLICDAHELTKYHNEMYDIILADPPYSNEEAKQMYDTGKLNYNTWTGEATKLLNENGLLIIYHKYIMPNPDPEIYFVKKRVFIGSRTYHTPRVALYFQKKIGIVGNVSKSIRVENYSLFDEEE